MGSIMSTPLTSTSDTVVCIISDGHTVVAILKTLTEVTVLPDVIAYVDKTGSAITDLQTRVARLEARVLALESQVDPSWPLPLPSAVRVDDGVTMGWAGLEFTFDLASRTMRIVCNDTETVYYAGADWTTDTAVIEFDAGRVTGYLTDLTVPLPNAARLGFFLERGVDSVLLQLSGTSASSSYTFSEV
jgi:hypothetical protein